ncbi:hypothetical protein M514_15765 [Trichuris suis]|uniref:Uncharacterized protein n=1 Tax=Trichuris suis TaxID=68888 RepID=A0A085NRG7_9BILA|nr:hypothetical protein M514_15765 [Trichuris suis]
MKKPQTSTKEEDHKQSRLSNKSYLLVLLKNVAPIDRQAESIAESAVKRRAKTNVQIELWQFFVSSPIRAKRLHQFGCRARFKMG